MGFLDWFRKDKKRKDKENGKKEKVEAKVEELPIETEDQKRDRAFDKYLNDLIDEGKRRGFDEVKAKKWAWKKIEERIAKNRSKGTPIVCSVCKKYGANSETGGLVKNLADGTYHHQNCK